MSSVLERLRKRRCYTHTIGGQTVHLRALTHQEIEIVSKFEDNSHGTSFVIGCCLLNEDESPAFTRDQNESPADFAKRVNQVLIESDLSTDTTSDLAAMAAKLSRGGSVEALAKNS